MSSESIRMAHLHTIEVKTWTYEAGVNRNEMRGYQAAVRSPSGPIVYQTQVYDNRNDAYNDAAEWKRDLVADVE